MTQDLFRQEALDARRSGWLGHIQLAQPVKLWLLTLGAVAAAGLVLAFLLLASYTRRSTVGGQLVPARGLSTLVAPAAGIVERLEVEEGSRVAAGQVLAVVVVPRATPGGGDAQRELQAQLGLRQEGLHAAQSAQHSQLAAQEAGLRRQLDAAASELAQTDAEIRTRAAQIRLARETLERLRQLEGERYVSLLQIKQQESVALAQLGEMQSLQRQASGIRRLIAQLRQAQDELPGQRRALDAGYARDLAVLGQEQVENQARGGLALTAPIDGIVAAQLAKPGQAVHAGQPVLTLLPGDGGLEAELLVPSHAIGFIEPGDAVLLRYQAFPYQKFGHQRGQVARISRSALGAGELGAQAGAAAQPAPLYRVTVTLSRQTVTAYGRQEPLRPGMLLDADILGEQRRLIEWVFEPLYSLKGRMEG